MDNDTMRSESPLSECSSTLSAPTDFLDSPSAETNMSVDSDGDDASLTGTPSTSTPRNPDARPSKRRRIDNYDHATPKSSNIPIPGSPAGSISSDSSGSVPNSPSFASLGPTHPLSTAYAAFQANPNDPESADYTQVIRCLWAGCEEPDQGNMDNLVQHINDVHIPPKQKKYFCEWEGCPRRASPHLSAYALKAHMRSHTKEKPFMCSVPECDRSFTRSDALAKHMRTVHETEALRPSDPISKGQAGGLASTDSKASTNGASIKPKLKLTFKKGDKSSAETPEAKVEGGIPALPTVSTAVAEGIAARVAHLDIDESHNDALRRAVDMDQVPFKLPIDSSYYPSDVYAQMEDYERNLPPSQWFRVLRRQIRWAEEDRERLEKDLVELKNRIDDLQGNPVIKDGKVDDVGDNIRLEEWSIVDNLLDRIGSASLEAAKKDMDADETEDKKGNTTMFEKVQTLPFFTKPVSAS